MKKAGRGEGVGLFGVEGGVEGGHKSLMLLRTLAIRQTTLGKSVESIRTWVKRLSFF